MRIRAPTLHLVGFALTSRWFWSLVCWARRTISA